MATNEILLLSAAGLFMGIVAVTSGGGATAGVPLVLLMGYPVATSVVAVSFGLLASFVTGTLIYRKLPKPAVQLPAFIWPVCIGASILGANLFLSIDATTLKALILAVLVAVLAITLATPRLKGWQQRESTPRRQAVGLCMVVALCFYCGFFGAGFGTFLILSMMYFFGYSFLDSASASTRFALVVGSASMVTFLARDAVSFAIAVPLAVGCSVGGYLGAHLARWGGETALRWAFNTSTVLLTLKLGYDLMASA